MLSSIGGDFIATSNESGTIMVIGRDTYDRRKEEGGIDADTIYFVIENAAHSELYLSLYVGLSKQSDIASLNQITGFMSRESSIDLTDFFDENDIPVKDILSTEKIYYWEDFDLNAFKAYIKSAITGEVLPLYGTPIWQTIES